VDGERYRWRDGSWSVAGLAGLSVGSGQVLAFMARVVEKKLRRLTGFKGRFHAAFPLFYRFLFRLSPRLAPIRVLVTPDMRKALTAAAERAYENFQSRNPEDAAPVEADQAGTQADPEGPNEDPGVPEAVVAATLALDMAMQDPRLAGHTGVRFKADREAARPAAIDPWEAFAESLSPGQREAMMILLRDGGKTPGLEALAQSPGMDLEALFEAINGSALDTAGDSILEMDVEAAWIIKEEYNKDLERVLA
jgi:hypothetical protein